MTLNLLGEHAKASVRHQAAVQLAPGSPQLLNNFGFSLYLERKYSEAEKQYESAIRSDPRMHLAYVNLGFALAAQAKEKDARRAFEQVLKPGEVLNNLALAAEMRGRPEAARELYQKAIADQPNLTEAVSNLKAWTHQTNQRSPHEIDVNHWLILLRRLMVLPGCAARDALAPTSDVQ